MPGSPPKVWQTKDIQQHLEAFHLQLAATLSSGVGSTWQTCSIFINKSATSASSTLLAKENQASRFQAQRHSLHQYISNIMGIHAGRALMRMKKKNFVASDYTCCLIGIPQRVLLEPLSPQVGNPSLPEQLGIFL